MSGYRDSFEPFGKPYDTHTPVRDEAVEATPEQTGNELVAVAWHHDRVLAVLRGKHLAGHVKECQCGWCRAIEHAIRAVEDL